MTVTDSKEVFYAVAGRCPYAASVLSNADGSRIALLHLSEDHSEAEIFRLADAGLNVQAGVVALNSKMQFESVCLPGFELPVIRAGVLFMESLKNQYERSEVAELEKLLKLEDPRASC
jgi:hypothetical protein